MKKVNYILGLVFVVFFSCTQSELDLSNSNLVEVVEEPEEDSTKPKCDITPSESAGSYPNRNPENLVRADITDGKSGVKLTLNLMIDYKNQPLKDAIVAVWHCDALGEYSQYGANESVNFLRGVQTTTTEGKVSFTTIFPGPTTGRAGHIYIEVKSANGIPLKITQVAFSQSVQDGVYQSSNYSSANTKNTFDNVFSDSLECNLPEILEGNITDGYTLTKTILIK